MPNVFFTSDSHFYHANIIKYCNRPFNGVDEMNSFMLQKWNEVVKPEDIVYYLGDFSFGHYDQNLAIFNRLNGTKILSSIGNHDSGAVKKLPWTAKHKHSNFFINQEWHYLSHYPTDVISESDQSKFNYKYYLHGHCHGTGGIHKNKIDVGVDCWNYTPVSFEQLKEKLDSNN